MKNDNILTRHYVYIAPNKFRSQFFHFDYHRRVGEEGGEKEDHED